MINLPNVLTLIRLGLIPVFVILFYWPTERSNFYAAIVFVIAAFTDLLDGYLARKLKLTTKFGAFLDPVADKIIVCTALVLIVEHYSLYRDTSLPLISHFEKFISIPAMIIVAREIIVSALREWMAEIGKRANVAVSWVGKWKTTIQLVAISGLIWRHSEPMIYAAVVLLGVATVLTIWSMIMYLKAGWIYMKEDPEKSSDK
ncbi:MAG: CDP-diacylglycerol--glycerol-3-phosphate 3-phosphatidyltransferase [Succinivibrio sp.]